MKQFKEVIQSKKSFLIERIGPQLERLQKFGLPTKETIEEVEKDLYLIESQLVGDENTPIEERFASAEYRNVDSEQLQIVKDLARMGSISIIHDELFYNRSEGSDDPSVLADFLMKKYRALDFLTFGISGKRLLSMMNTLSSLNKIYPRNQNIKRAVNMWYKGLVDKARGIRSVQPDIQELLKKRIEEWDKSPEGLL